MDTQLKFTKDDITYTVVVESKDEDGNPVDKQIKFDGIQFIQLADQMLHQANTDEAIISIELIREQLKEQDVYSRTSPYELFTVGYLLGRTQAGLLLTRVASVEISEAATQQIEDWKAKNNNSGNKNTVANEEE